MNDTTAQVLEQVLESHNKTLMDLFVLIKLLESRIERLEKKDKSHDN